MSKIADMRNLRFLMYEVLNVEELTEYERYEDHGRETFDMALDTAEKMATDLFQASFQEFEKDPARLEGDTCVTPAPMKEIWKQAGEGGWFAVSADYDVGGQQFPMVVEMATSFLFAAGNNSAIMYVGVTTGAAHLIESYGTDALKEKYMMRMYSGEFGGTMALTEPQAGSSLADIATTASPVDGEDYYMIKGTKVFISAGDHDLAENIVHPVLARIDGAPPGVKGISLFIVPKYLVNDDGSIGEFNDVVTTALEHKLGLKGQSTAALNFGDDGKCRGWLLGEPNKGLKYMFQMMNHARVFTGVQATASASAAYQCSLDWARERLQGRDVQEKDPTTPPIPIIKHTDIRIMLLRQKAFLEGMLGLLLFGAKQMDLLRVDPDNKNAHYLLEILTPCLKAFASDQAFISIRHAIQILGGAGFGEELPCAQLMRDCKVFSIYEGSNGIQALDLVGRKIPTDFGAAMKAVSKTIAAAIEEAMAIDGLKKQAEALKEASDAVAGAIKHLTGVALTGQINLYLANATECLEMFSKMLLAWQLLVQATVAHKALEAGTSEEAFYKGKIETAKFYINLEMAHVVAAAQYLRANDRTALDYDENWFF